MGIHHFFQWFKHKFAEDIYHLKKGETVVDLEIPVDIDNLMIDMNGIFHSSAQKIYQYGDHKPHTRLLKTFKQVSNSSSKQRDVFKDVCESINNIVNIAKPKKRLILCVDGPAPLSKQNQQRQRRFMSGMQNTKCDFDSCAITPGTKFMDHLSKYIDWYLRMKMSEPNSTWGNLEIVFSNEKVAGEGEHKLINYIRKYGSDDESYCINGMDADLIMLSLGTHKKKFYILREEPRNREIDFYVIDIGSVHFGLSELMKWNGDKPFEFDSAINDFIFMCFTVGNDFLPHIPAIEIVEGSIDFMLDVYKNVGEHHGHLTKNTRNGICFRKKSVVVFLGTIAQYEKGVLENKLIHKDKFFTDLILEGCATFRNGKYELNLEEYKKEYYEKNFEDVNEEVLCHEYLEGMQWVLSYYTRGVPNWKWRFRFHYAPFTSTLANYTSTFKMPVYGPTTPSVPFVQLLSVLSPKSAHLLPSPLDKLLQSADSPISEYCPDKFDVDLSGKRQEWQGIVILPMVDYNKIEQVFFANVKNVDAQELKRNIAGKSFVYRTKSDVTLFKSYYGDIMSKVQTEIIDI